VSESEDTLRVAALQYDVVPDVDENRASVGAGLEQAAARGVQLVLLPEMWASSFPPGRTGLEERVAGDREAAAWLGERSAALGLAVAGSSLATEDGELRNRLELFDGGEARLVYDKVHLFTPTAEQELFGAGDRPPATVEVQGARVSGGICYDLRFPELWRMPFRGGAQVLLCPAQWPTPRDGHLRSLTVARAVECQAFVVSCNRTGRAVIGRRKLELDFPGNSLIVSPYGEILAEGAGESGLVTAELELRQVRSFRTRVPVVKDELPELYRRWYAAGC